MVSDTVQPKVFTEPQSMREYSQEQRKSGRRIALVPTMVNNDLDLLSLHPAPVQHAIAHQLLVITGILTSRPLVPYQGCKVSVRGLIKCSSPDQPGEVTYVA